MQQTVKQWLREQIASVAEGADFDVMVSPNPKLGDYSTNIAFVLAKKEGKKPAEVAEALKKELNLGDVCDIAVAPNGFLNFFLKPEFVQKKFAEIPPMEHFGRNELWKDKTVMVEYTDPNPFKLFHIGHLMSNTIGEAIARLYNASGAKVLRVNYQGDVGLHIAKAIWGLYLTNQVTPIQQLDVHMLGQGYARGVEAFEKSEEDKKNILEINEIIYNVKPDKTESQWVNKWYKEGKKVSLEYFDLMYKKLGTKFDYYFFESEVADAGLELVKSHPEIFKESEGAIVFKGEDYGLHTRVFINSKGLPVYEAKELAVNKKKFDEYHPDRSIVVTGNEINEYFKVLLKVMSLILPDVASKMKHVSHGMMRLPSGKMSSRTGDVITADSLIEQAKEKFKEKESRESDDETREAVAVGAIKYSILKQSPGHDIIFDFDKSLAVKGDSGPYLQYTYARLKAILGKAGEVPTSFDASKLVEPAELALIKHLFEFPDVIQQAMEELAPQRVALFDFQLAELANAFYEQVHILEDEDKSRMAACLVLVSVVATVLSRGLSVLGIKSPERI